MKLEHRGPRARRRILGAALAALVGVGVVTAQHADRPSQESAGPSSLATTTEPGLTLAVAFGVSLPVADLLEDIPLRATAPGDFTQSKVGVPQLQAATVGTSRDEAVQSIQPLPNMPSVATSFDGLSSQDVANAYGGNRIAPPNTSGEIGPNHYVQAVNLLFGIYNKSTGLLAQPPFKLNTLFTSASPSISGICTTNNNGEALVMYDQLADRWLLTQVAYATSGTPPYHQCVAISKTSDPTGQYYVFDFVMPGNVAYDSPRFGLWPDGYYMTANEVTSGGAFNGVGIFAFDRAKMLAGDRSAGVLDFHLRKAFPVGTTLSSMLPADLDGPALPPTGTPAYFGVLGARVNAFGTGQPTDTVRLFAFRANFAIPSASNFAERPESPLAVAIYDARSPSGRNDIEQPGPATASTYLDSVQDRLLSRLAYRNLGGTRESLVVTHTVNVGADPTTAAGHQAAVRYYEFGRNLPSGKFTTLEQATFAPDADSRWMGSAAMDRQGNLAVGYSVSGLLTHPSIRFAGRLAADPPNGLHQGEAELVTGSGVQLSTSGRWGDISALTVDPNDDCTFWYTTEYYTLASQATSAIGWLTRIGSFKFPGCGVGAVAGSIKGTVRDASTGAPVANAKVTVTATGSSSSSSSYTDLAGSYTQSVLLNIPYTMTATATGYGTVSVNGLVVATNGGVVIQDVSLPAAPTITTHPSTQTVSVGQNATFTAFAIGSPTPAYQWQGSSDGLSWANLANAAPYSGVATTTLNVINVPGTLAGWRYRAVATNLAGSRASLAATLVVSGAPVFTTQPVSQAVNTNESATFTVAATGTPGPTLQWQVSIDGGMSFADLTETPPQSGVSTTTLLISGVTSGLDGYQYRAIAANTIGSATSNPAMLLVNAAGAPSFTAQPTAQTVVAGQTATFTVSAIGNPAPAYAWQASADAGASWTDLANTAPYSGVTAATLTIAGTTLNLNGVRYRARASNNLGVATSNTATLTVMGNILFSTLAGSAGVAGSADGTGTAARFYSPAGVAVDGAGGIYVADMFNHTIRRISASGVVTTLAGLAGTAGVADGTGAAARFNTPFGIAVDGTGTVYVTDAGNGTIRKITSGGTVTTLAGQAGSIGNADGSGSTARFMVPLGLSIDSAGTLYLADSGNSTIRKVSPAGVVTTLAGLAGITGGADGTGNTARFFNPYGVAVSGAGAIYVADSGNSLIRRVTSTGVVTTVAGLAGAVGSADGTGAAARFNTPYGIAVDSTDVVFIADTFNHTIRRISTTGVVTTLAGLAGSAGSADGEDAVARFFRPYGVAVDGVGTLYVADAGNATLRKGTISGSPAFTSQPASQLATAGSSAAFTVAASGTPAPTYQWQASTDAGATWTDLTDDATYSGAATTTLTVTNVTAALHLAQYRAVATNSSGSATSASATLALTGAPVIGTQPGNQTIDEGQTATFTVAAAGTPAPTYQWQMSTDGVSFTDLTELAPYGGTNTATLTVSAATVGLNGNRYRVLATNGAGSATSNAAIFTVNALTPPAIATQPTNQSVTQGQTATFTIAATGNPSPTYQWQVSSDGGNVWASVTDAAPYSGSTTTTLTVSGATIGLNTYQYRSVATNGLGTVTSNAATLTVSGAPTFTTQPIGQTVTAGQTATFTVAVSGTPTPTIQWQVSTNGGVSFTDLTNTAPYGGVTTTTLTITNVSGSLNNYRYQAIASSSAGSAVSTAATLTILGAPVFVTQPIGQAASAGQTTTFTVAASGTPTPTLQWQVSVNGGVSFADLTNTAPYNGVTTATLTVSSVSSSLHGYLYRAVAGNSVGTATSAAATLTVNTPPAITTPPASQTVVAGANASFTVSASGTPAPAYQWQISTNGGTSFADLTNTAPYSGVSTGTLTVTSATVVLTGLQYRAIATNSSGTATSSAATLTVTAAPAITTQPASQTVSSGANASFTVAASGTPAPTYQWQISTNGGTSFVNLSNAAPYGGVTTGTLTVTSATVGLTSHQYRAVATNSTGSVTSIAATLTVTAAPAITTQPSSQTVAAGANVFFTATATGDPAPTYQWQVSTNGGGSFADVTNAAPYSGVTTGTLSVTNVTVALTGTQYRVVATNTTGAATSTAATLTVTAGPVITTQPASQTIVAGGNATFTVTMTGTPAPTLQWQVSTNGGTSFTDLTNGAPYGGVTTATLTVTSASAGLTGNQYRTVATNSTGSATSTAATLTVTAAAAITTPPSNQTVAAGGNLSFAVAASGAPTPTLQWQISTNGGASFVDLTNAAPYSGVTTTTLAVTNVPVGLNGSQYRAVATNSTGTATSTAATLSVTLAPAIATQPGSQTVTEGQSATFTVAASGLPAPTYQWQASSDGGVSFTTLTNTAPHSGVTTATLTVSAAPLSVSGTQYRAVAANSVGVATSSAATLTVINSYAVLTLAGTAGTPGSTDDTGSLARFSAPQGVAVDNAGTVYVADTGNHTIRKITPAGVATTFAGLAGSPGSTDETGSLARFSSPRGVTVDSTGTVYVADTGNHTIRKITAAGVVTTVAGSAGSPGSTDATGNAARFSSPNGVAVDSAGILYVADTNNHTLRTITVAGVVSTVAGTALSPGSTDDTGSAAQFNFPTGIAVGSTGVVYVADQGGHTVRKMTTAGVVSTLAGTAGSPGSTDGTGSAARFSSPTSVAVDASGSAYVADSGNSTLRKITAAGVVTTVAGLAGSAGSADGTGTGARFNAPAGVAVDAAGVVYVGDQGNHTIRKAAPASSPVFATPPVDQTATVGQTATFTVAVGGFPSPTLQWQESTTGGALWTDLTNTAPYSGVTTTTLTLSSVTAPMTGYQYRVVAANSAGTSTSTAATLTVNTPPAVTTQPSSQTVAAGQTALFTVVATGNPAPTYQWQVSTDGVSFTDLANGASYSGVTTGTLTVTSASVGLTGTQYRAVATNSTGTATSAAAPLTVTAAPAITTHPTSPTVAAGENASFTAAASGTPAPAFQWQISTNGGVSFADLANGAPYSGVTTGTLTVTGATVGLTGNQYRAVATNSTGSAASTAAALTVTAAPAITTQPIDQTVVGGTDTSFTAAASGTPAPTLQWQVSTSGGASFADLTNGAPYSGVTSGTLTVTSATVGLTGNQYRAVAINSTGTATSTAATLTVTAAAAITTQPSSQTAAAGANASFPVAVSGTPAPTLQWQISTNGGTSFTDLTDAAPYSGVTTITLTITSVTVDLTTNQYRAVATNSTGTATSTAAALTVTAAPAITTQPSSQTVGVGGNTSFTVAASGTPPPALQWQVSTNGGASFANLTNSAPYSGVATGTLSVTNATTGLTGYQYRAVATNSTGTATSTAATLTITIVPAITTQPASQTAVAGTNASFIVAVSGTPAPTLQWQVSVNGGASFTDAADGALYSGVTTGTLTVLGVTVGLTGTQYRAVATNSSGVATSSAAMLTVPAVAITTQPASLTVAPGTNAVFTSAAAGIPTPTYQWQVSTTGGTSWTSLTDTAPYSGTTTATLTVSSATVELTGTQYRVVASNSGGTATSAAAMLTVVNPYAFTTVAGLAGTFGSADATGLAARFRSPNGMAVDSAGTLYIADTTNYTIRKITAAGVVTTLAGFAGSSGSTDGTGSAARFNSPGGVAVDSAGTVYVADTSNHKIRQITTAGVVTTLAGTGTAGTTDGAASAARFNLPRGVAVDSAGTVYVADFNSQRIRKITAGVVTTVAGSSLGSADGTGSAAQFSGPSGVAVDSTGTLYVADYGNNRIRKITAAGVVTTLAGSSVGSADGTGTAARFNLPRGVAVDGAGTVYVADTSNHTIRKITPAGVVTTIGGLAGAVGSADGTGAAAQFASPQGVAVDGAGILSVADTNNHTIRKGVSAGSPEFTTQPTNQTVNVDETAIFTVAVAATGAPAPSLQWYGSTTGGTSWTPLTETAPYSGTTTPTLVISSVTAGLTGNQYRAVATNSVGSVTSLAATLTTVVTLAAPVITTQPTNRTVDTGQTATFTVAATGNPTPTYQWQVSTDGGGSFANVTNTAPYSGVTTVTLAVSGVTGSLTGTQYRALASNSGGTATSTAATLTVVNAYTFTTVAGLAGASGSTDATGLAARFFSPNGVAVDAAGTLYVADTSNHTIRKITAAGVVTTLAGLANTTGSTDGTGSAARFNNPRGVAVDSAGTVYVADRTNFTIRKITAAGVVTTLAGVVNTAGSTDGAASAARFNFPEGVAVDSAGTVYVADTSNHRIRKITATGVVTTLAGSSLGSVDGTGTAARFDSPRGVAVDGAGTVYVADTSASTIRRVTAAGVVTTLAGLANATGSTDGTGTIARFSFPYGVAVDSAGSVYVADTSNHSIRKITAAGVVTTIGGLAGVIGSADGTGSAAQFVSPKGVAVDSTGTLYVADTGNHTIRKGVSAGSPEFTTQPANQTVNVDETAIFTVAVAATGTPLPSLQWQVSTTGGTLWANLTNAAPYSGTTTTTLVINSVTAGLGGTQYRAVATNSVGSVTSLAATLTTVVTLAAPVITTQPTNRTVDTGQTATFTVGATGNPTPTYQWQVSTDGGGSFANVTNTTPFSGATTNTLTVSSVTGSLTGTQYRALASNSGGTATSTAATLTVVNAYTFTTVAGLAGASGSTDAPGVVARFNSPYGVAVDGAGTVYVADTNNHTIRKITAAGVVTTLAGMAGSFGSTDATGAAARFNAPRGVAVDSASTVYVADRGNHTIRKITAAGVVTTLAGQAGSTGSTDATGSAARFASPEGVAVDSAGTVYVADTSNRRIRKITAGGVVTTVAGSGITCGSVDGTGLATSFCSPSGMAIDSSGTLYVADRGNHTIRKMTTAEVVTTLAGLAGNVGSADGTGTAARFSSPNEVSVDSAGIVYVADTGNNTIRKITPAGVVTTIAGSAGATGIGSADGTGGAAQFVAPQGVAVDSAGTLFVADTGNHTIRKGTP